MVDISISDSNTPRVPRAYRKGAARTAPSAICRIDRRTAGSRRFEFLARTLGEGLDVSDQVTRTAVEAAAIATMRLEEMGARILAGESVAEAEATRITNSHSRAMRQLDKLKKRRGEAGKRPLDQYLADKAARVGT